MRIVLGDFTCSRCGENGAGAVRYGASGLTVFPLRGRVCECPGEHFGVRPHARGSVSYRALLTSLRAKVVTGQAKIDRLVEVLCALDEVEA